MITRTTLSKGTAMTIAKDTKTHIKIFALFPPRFSLTAVVVEAPSSSVPATPNSVPVPAAFSSPATVTADVGVAVDGGVVDVVVAGHGCLQHDFTQFFLDRDPKAGFGLALRY
jgi:hypothetical protein